MSESQTAFSTESGRTYTLNKLIGKGGFGEVYLATPSPRDGLPEQVCVKITERLSSWLREAYFAELLFREPRALKVYDRFAEVENGKARYCIALEYAVHGDLSVWLAKKGPQSERFVRRVTFFFRRSFRRPQQGISSSLRRAAIPDISSRPRLNVAERVASLRCATARFR